MTVRKIRALNPKALRGQRALGKERRRCGNKGREKRARIHICRI